jgi:hypothetical protein
LILPQISILSREGNLALVTYSERIEYATRRTELAMGVIEALEARSRPYRKPLFGNRKFGHDFNG